MSILLIVVFLPALLDFQVTIMGRHFSLCRAELLTSYLCARSMVDLTIVDVVTSWVYPSYSESTSMSVCMCSLALKNV